VPLPKPTNYPEALDTDENLFVVRDSLRVKLSQDYTPGDKSIKVFDSDGIMNLFPDSGIITLTEQCSDIDKRAISFFYSYKSNDSFDGLEILPGFKDVPKFRNITNVTQNVMASHHNHIKDAIIAIEEFIGTKGTVDLTPKGPTLVGRINFLKKLILTPRAWFSMSNRVGIVPLCVTFKDESFRLGDGEVIYLWDFGDQDLPSGTSATDLSIIPATSTVPINETNVIVQDLDGGSIVKCYNNPGKYTVKLTVKNENGEDTVAFQEIINARFKAPQEAVINFVPRTGQSLTPGSPSGGPYVSVPIIRSSTGTQIDAEVPDGENPNTPGVTYAGEYLSDLSNPIDPIVEYTWSFGDDLSHDSSFPTATALYTIGGVYDLKLRVDTSFGSYRITTYENAIEIIEKTNLWQWNINGSMASSSEFGLVSETFKVNTNTLSITRDDNFLNGTPNENQGKQEFRRNVGFTPRGTISSGDHGTSMIYWSSGGSPISAQEIRMAEYEGFGDLYISRPSIPDKPWNWTVLNSPTKSYFLFGQDPNVTPNQNKSLLIRTDLDLTTLSYTTESIESSNLKNGATELENNVSSFDGFGVPENGYFSTYRSSWKDNAGYILRNDGVGAFFRIRSFYRTEGTLGEEFIDIVKLNDMAGNAKLEGQLVTLDNGVYFFNNSGTISAFNTSSGVWETGGTSAAFTSVQDTTISGFNNLENTLLASSDGDRTVYLSYDYSPNAFVKFNAVDLTFSNIGPRPVGEQFLAGVY